MYLTFAYAAKKSYKINRTDNCWIRHFLTVLHNFESNSTLRRYVNLRLFCTLNLTARLNINKPTREVQSQIGFNLQPVSEADMAASQIHKKVASRNKRGHLNLPKYIHSFIDNRGKRRFRYYRRGYKGKYIKSDYGTKEFYEECQRAASRSLPNAKIKKRVQKAGDTNRLKKFIGLEPPTKDVRTVDCLYIMRDGTQHKVGRSVRPWRRLYRIRRTSRPETELLRIFPVTGTDSYKAESGAHKLLAPYAVGGEWFTCDYEIARNAIRLSMESAGEPFLNLTTKTIERNGFSRP